MNLGGLAYVALAAATNLPIPDASPWLNLGVYGAALFLLLIFMLGLFYFINKQLQKFDALTQKFDILIDKLGGYTEAVNKNTIVMEKDNKKTNEAINKINEAIINLQNNITNFANRATGERNDILKNQAVIMERLKQLIDERENN